MWRGATARDGVAFFRARGCFARVTYQPTKEERIEELKRYIGPAIAVVVVIVTAIWVAWIELGRRSKETASGALVKTLAAEGSEAELQGLEKKYQSALDAGAGDTAVEEILDQAIGKVRGQIQRGRTAAPEMRARLARLESARGTLHARIATARSEALEREAAQARARGQTEIAAEKLREAFHLQREASALAPTTERMARESHLAADMAQLDAEPLHARIEVARALGSAAAARDSWDEAAKAFQEARAAQVELNQRFPAAHYADPAAIAQLDAEIESIHATALARGVAASETAADLAATAGRTGAAAGGYATALEGQRELNVKFPRSRFASDAHLEELQAKRETVLSVDAWEKAAALDREAAAALRNRQAASGAAKIGEAAALLAQAASSFPHSRRADAALRARIEFLAAHRGELEAWQKKLLDELVRLPGVGDVRVSKTEVPAELFAALMGAKSGARARAGADQAREFCARVSWVIGAPARLPTEAELGAVPAVAANAMPRETAGFRFAVEIE